VSGRVTGREALPFLLRSLERVCQCELKKSKEGFDMLSYEKGKDEKERERTYQNLYLAVCHLKLWVDHELWGGIDRGERGLVS
jgi:hypothetical protein